MEERRSLFPDEEPSLLPKKPKPVQNITKKGRKWGMIGSLGVAIILHSSIKGHLTEKNQRNIQGMMDIAEASGAPLIVTETKTTIGNRVSQVLNGEDIKPDLQTTIINPPGVEPAIQVITPDATISAGKTGEIEEIIPAENTTEKPLTTTEAKQAVVKAIQDAAEKTLPKEEQVVPLAPKKD